MASKAHLLLLRSILLLVFMDIVLSARIPKRYQSEDPLDDKPYESFVRALSEIRTGDEFGFREDEFGSREDEFGSRENKNKREGNHQDGDRTAGKMDEDSSRVPREFEVVARELPRNGDLFEEDIIMDERMRGIVLGTGAKKSAYKDSGMLWPDGVLVYDVDPSFVAGDLLQKAIDEFSDRTCIRFKRKTTEKDYVYYTSAENMCSSNVGRVGGMQKVFIGKDCKVLGTVLHETMHALGIVHEHSRPERDKYVRVIWDNIKKEEWNNFHKYSTDDVTSLDVPYNFASVMHYRNDAFAMRGGDTLVPIGVKRFSFGQREKWSKGDVDEINRLYECKSRLLHPKYDNLFDTVSVDRQGSDRADGDDSLLTKLYSFL